ncbi:carbonic anhydrase family protein [Herminiimonas arsenitoxidans]|uniref:carbonic anhydrase family protein n=1 Tax=Herminiimonas arsenitoxidans TaxID=1809410 RepID=UPI00097093EB|nr:carbonic anhydrase family protein [Herminiimonas arsenitoxidans]
MQAVGSGRWLRRVSVLMASLVLAACASQQGSPSTSAHPAVMTQQVQSSMTAEQALQLLKDGNARFVSGKGGAHDLPAQVLATGKNGQFPFVSIVSCIDSRSSPSLVFDLGIGDAFNARVAGNVINEDILGSLEYASKVAGAKLIVVLGHTSCGAVKGACDNIALGNLSGLLAKIRPAVNATSDTKGADRSSHNYAFVDAVAENNVKRMVQAVQDRSPILREMAANNQVKIVGAMLDVKTGEVKFY